MSAQWKPGDVVAATVNGRENIRLVAGWSKYDPQLRWGELSPRWADGDDDTCWFMPYQVTDHRPLVVIDPEDRDDVVDLAAAFNATGSPQLGAVFIDRLQAALRSLLPPSEASTQTVPVVHAVMYRDLRMGTLCDSGAWGTPELFTAVTEKVTCPGCRHKLDGGGPS